MRPRVGRPQKFRLVGFELRYRDPEGGRVGTKEDADKFEVLRGPFAGEAAAETERRLMAGLLEAMPGVFYLYDERGSFLRWNKNFEQVSGYGPAEIRALHPLELFAGEDRARVAERIAQVFETGQGAVEASLVSKSGAVTPHFFTGRRIVLGESPLLIGVGVDITERKRAEEAVSRSEERYRTTLEGMIEGCQLLGFDWRYLYLNPAAAKQNRRPNEELLGVRMTDAWPGIEGTQIFALLRRCMSERVAAHDEIEFQFADGTSAWFDVRAQPVPEGIFVLSIDISERRIAERVLKDLNESLEQRVRERTRELEMARERAESADKLKSAFLATMSHELRTPLNSILGFTGIVLKGMAGPLTSEQSKQLGMVQGSARHLLDLINDVLDLSKIEAGQLVIRSASFDVVVSVERVVASLRPLAERKGLTLDIRLPSGPIAMASDQRRVEQILLNLLGNGIKFTERGGVTLSVTQVFDPAVDGVEAARSWVRFVVSDTGIGIKAEDLGNLFRPFRQLDSGLQRQHEGTGLGLAISRRLAELLGGAIFAESSSGHGSRFTVSLPSDGPSPVAVGP